MKEVPTISSVSHAIKLVEALATTTASLNVSEMADALGLPRATVYRLVGTLKRYGWVVQEDKRYRLSYRLPGLFDRSDLASVLTLRATPLLNELVEKTGETAHFAVREGYQVVYRAKVDSPHPIRMSSYVGWRGPLHATAVGKVLLAWSDSDLVPMLCTQGLARYTPHTIVSELSLRSELRRVRARGYAIDNQEFSEGQTCVAAPILKGGSVLGALSIAGPSSRIRDPEALAKALISAVGSM